MKRIFVVIICAIVLCGNSLSVAATEPSDSIRQKTVIDNRIVIVDEISVFSHARSSEKSAERKRSIYDGDTLIAVIAFQATFRYDGVSASVVSKILTQEDTYSGWSFKQSSFTSSGNTVTLEGKLKYLLILKSENIVMSVSCDKNGNITYS